MFEGRRGKVLSVLLFFFLLKHFSPGRKKNELYVSSLYYAAKSKTLRNMLLSAGLVTYLAKRFLGYRLGKSFPAFFFTIWGLIYKFRVVETPKVWYKRTYWNTHIVEKARISQTEFWPVFWLFNRHAQTVTCFVLSALEWLWARPIEFERQVLPCFEDVNEQYVDWAHYDSEEDSHTTLPGGDSSPVIICIHGLGDNRNAPYIKRFTRKCLRNGWRVAIWSYWRFDFEESRDLKIVIDSIQQKYPRAPLVGVAWSAGTYSLTRYLEKAGEDSPLVCAICQSGCLDFPQAIEDVTLNENKTYPLFLLKQTHVCIRRHVANDKRIIDKKTIRFVVSRGVRSYAVVQPFLFIAPPTGARYHRIWLAWYYLPTWYHRRENTRCPPL
mmetsp:Transcript_32622/g.52023  ORF Transcript_32622/g.52023 Transcript_32622/m.52023 type:complete len:382 (-) Transcript_32622:517-1662(-)